MPTARIFQRPKSSMQSGQSLVGQWQLVFAPAEAKRPDPLTGWAGSGDTLDQVRLTFPSSHAAIEYCARKGWEYELVPPPVHSIKLQSYADNFR